MTGIDGWVQENLGVTLRTDASPVGLDLADLLGVAVRQNPRRAHLLVSTVLGKHIPTDPALVHGAGLLLGALVGLALDGDPVVPTSWSVAARAAMTHRPAALTELFADHRTHPATPLVLGFAETATGLGHSVADALGAPYYLHSTRRIVPGIEMAGTFEEGHSHASTHYLVPAPKETLQQSLPLVLVDDEFSTGRTLMATISELQRQFPRRHYVVAALVDLRDEQARREMDAFAATLEVRIDVVSLVSGGVGLPEDLLTDATQLLSTLPTPEETGGLPDGDLTTIEIPWPQTVPEGGRHGFTAADGAGFEDAVLAACDRLRAALPGAHRVLVLGTEEFMYLPMRLAMGLTDRFEVRYQTTTRSPVFPVAAPDYPVQRRIRFADPEGDTVAPRYLNNADWTRPGEKSEVIVVLVEGPADSAALYTDGGLVPRLRTLGCPVVVAALVGPDPLALTRSRSTAESPTPRTPTGEPS